MVICTNIVEDTSNHITIHKAKGAEFENVFVIGNKDTLSLLLKPDLMNDEEHRIFYVAMSRAKKKLFYNLIILIIMNKRKLRNVMM